MPKTEHRGVVEYDGAQIDIRFVSQARRDAITEKHTRRIAGVAIGKTDWDRVNEELADEIICGWSGMKLATVMRMGYEQFDELTPDAEGDIAYSAHLAREFCTKTLRVLRGGEPGFAQAIDEGARSILEALASKNAAASPSSESSPASTA